MPGTPKQTEKMLQYEIPEFTKRSIRKDGHFRFAGSGSFGGLCGFAGGVVALAVALAGAAPTLVAAQPVRDIGDARLENAIVASVDGRPVTLRELRAFESGRGRLLSPGQRRSMSTVLDALVSEIMYNAEFARIGIYAQDSDVHQYIERLLAQNRSTRDQVRKALAEAGFSWEDYFERMRHEVQRLALVNRVVRSRVSVSPEEVKRRWKESPDYATVDSVEIAHIYLPYDQGATSVEMGLVEARVKEAHAAAKENFGKAARQYSAGPTADNDGKLGRFKRGTMLLLFEREVVKLEEGEVSDPFQAEGAYHMLKLLEILPAGRIPLEEVREQIREELYGELLEERFRRWTNEDLRKRYHVTLHFDRVASLL